MFRQLIASLAMVLAVTSAGSLAHDARQDRAATAASGLASTNYAFPLPEPGSYKLPPIKRAAGGRVLDESGRAFDLAGFFKGRVTVLAFIYTRCGDICPVASLQLSLLQDLAATKHDVANQIRLVSVSFDPEYDTPEVMAEHAANWRSKEPGAPDWQFLTAPDREAIAPILAAYDQTIGPKRDPNSPTGPLHHIFRAFLVDASGRIRNIYSLDFLDPRLVLNDIQTLLLEKHTNTNKRTAR
ncbi:MAG: SCO family protein [Pseudolabrys sp.]|jgi:protein SCO1/2